MNGQGELLTHYLKNADKLIIPVYQRNYDWREEHCKKLYQDLVRTIQNKKRWHFFGGIVSVSDPMGSSSDYLDELLFFRSDTLQKSLCRLVSRVLRYQLALDCLLQYRLLEGFWEG